jgi:hypothetical protein
MLLILWLILPISGLSGLLKAIEGPLGTPNQCFLLCVVLDDINLFHAIQA